MRKLYQAIGLAAIQPYQPGTLSASLVLPYLKHRALIHKLISKQFTTVLKLLYSVIIVFMCHFQANSLLEKAV